MKKIKTILLMSVAMAMNSMAFTQNSQTFLSEYWSGESGLIQTPIISTLVTKTDAMHNVYVAGATLNTTTNKLDMMVRKFSRQGDLLWTTTFGGALEEDDIAADLFIDDNYDVYVTGAIAETAQNFYDLAVIKLNSNGIVQWEYYYDYGGSPIPYDAGTAITGDNDGHIYVTGSSAGNNTNSDYVIIKLTSANASEVWVERYDYDGYDDVPAKIELHTNNEKVVISGASQSDDNPITWEMAMVVMDSSNQYFQDYRTGQSITGGVSEVYDMTVDPSGNIYVVGTKKNATTDYDLTVYKLDDELNLIWEETYDGYEDDDRGKGIKVDNQGNVYVAGYVTTDNEGKNYILIKYDGNGNMEWSREYNGLASLDDEAVQLVINDANKIFVTGSAVHDTNSDFVTLGYDEDGNLFNEITFNGDAGLNDTPSNMAIDLEGNIIVVGQSQTGGPNFENVAVKYTVHEKPKEFIFDNGEPVRISNHILVQFDTSAINTSRIDQRNFKAGNLDEFVKPYVIDSLDEQLDFETARLPTYKIFRRMTTADSISTTRLGDEIRIPNYWAWLMIIVPEEEDDEVVLDSLLNMNDSIVKHAEFNTLFTLDSNDPLLTTEQSSLVYNPNFPLEPHINVEDAWAIETGKDYVKVGVFDETVHWEHEDFGNGTFSGSKIVGGWDFVDDVNLQDAEPKTNHGTAVAGIIGAKRNNNTGIAGIAGGDVDNDQNTGVQLFSLGITMPAIPFPGDTIYVISMEHAVSSIVEGAVETPSFGYGLHVQNHSWSGNEYAQNPTTLGLKLAVHTAWRNHSVFVASRGNNGDDELLYPACYDDRQVISVMANGIDKNLAHGPLNNNTANGFNSSWGGNADVLAPGISSLVTTTTSPDYITNYSDNCSSAAHPDYQCFDGTSAAAPHVSGVAALMYSKHNTVNGAPNNLTTEDIENILETTAHGSSSYDPQNGWGLIDAGKALEMIDYPEYYVKHGTQLSHTPTGATLTQTGVMISVTQSPMASEAGLPPGAYLADQYKLDWTLVEVLPSHLEIINWWPLGAKSSGISANPTVLGEHWVDASANINGNSISIEAETYCWVAYYAVGSQQAINNIFIPADAPQCEFHYSLHVHNTTLNTDEYDQENTVNLYPNPTAELVNIEFELSKTENVTMEIYDMQGVKIATPQIGNKEQGKHKISVNTAHLSSGMYVIKLHYGEEMISKKFIKK